MYIPKPFEETRLDVLHGLIRQHPLGTWVSSGQVGLNVDHIPFILDASEGAVGTLYGHVARANPVWKESSAQMQHVVIFRGPQAYITPNWYPSKKGARPGRTDMELRDCGDPWES